MSDGSEVRQNVRIQLPTGEIQPLRDRRADLGVPLFSEQFKSMAQASDRQSEALATLLAAE